MENELKSLVESIPIDEQIANLKANGLIIENENYAREILNNISYFRIIKAYSLRLKPKNGTYEEGVKFEDITDLYFFNANLRHILFPMILIGLVDMLRLLKFTEMENHYYSTMKKRNSWYKRCF